MNQHLNSRPLLRSGLLLAAAFLLSQCSEKETTPAEPASGGSAATDGTAGGPAGAEAGSAGESSAGTNAGGSSTADMAGDSAGTGGQLAATDNNAGAAGAEANTGGADTDGEGGTAGLGDATSMEGGAGSDVDAGSAGDAATSQGGTGLPIGDSGSTSPDAGPPATPNFSGPYQLLSETGLYSDTAAGVLAPGVRPYDPQFELWTDNAEKLRWIYLPEGSQIDTSDIDDWIFPIGTKIWKEFIRDGIRIETRILERLPEEREDEGIEGWLLVAFVWNEELTDAVITPDGLQNASGTDHDVPDMETCMECHDTSDDKPLGVSAVQLSHGGAGVTLTTLIEEDWLTDPPVGDLEVPGNETERAVLGYFHANCGHCHRRGARPNARILSFKLWLQSDALASVEETETYLAIVNQYAESAQGSELEFRIAGQAPEASEIIRRITLRDDSSVPMPPYGSEIVDEVAVELITDWINSLDVPTE